MPISRKFRKKLNFRSYCSLENYWVWSEYGFGSDYGSGSVQMIPYPVTNSGRSQNWRVQIRNTCSYFKFCNVLILVLCHTWIPLKCYGQSEPFHINLLRPKKLWLTNEWNETWCPSKTLPSLALLKIPLSNGSVQRSSGLSCGLAQFFRLRRSSVKISSEKQGAA
jgi:hypothetical protein